MLQIESHIIMFCSTANGMPSRRVGGARVAGAMPVRSGLAAQSRPRALLQRVAALAGEAPVAGLPRVARVSRREGGALRTVVS